MRLIDADALKREPELLYGLTVAITEIQDVIDEAPTVEERKRGHWEDIDLDTSVCSVCKKPQEYETKYCPECGAKMENNGDDDDE